MTPEQFEQAIRFDVFPEENGVCTIRAKLVVWAEHKYSKDNIKLSRLTEYEIIEDIKQKLREMILRKLYEDRRKEMYDALMEMLKASPYDNKALWEKLMTLARRMCPEFVESTLPCPPTT